MIKRTVLTLLALVLSAATIANAAIINFDVSLSGANENPANASPGSGSADIAIDTVLRTMSIDVTFADLLGLTTAAHIHCCALPPANVMVATQVPNFEGFPLGVSSGSYSHLFDMTLASSYNPAFITAHGGTVSSAFDDLLAGMLGGRSYLNIHSTLFGGGEIRGTLIQVPEPASLALWGVALAGLALSRRRRSA
ncbi:MAG: CHRD domain-containing protein [Burkholderiaceae bacterium]